MDIIEKNTQTLIEFIQHWSGTSNMNIVYDSDLFPNTVDSFMQSVSYKSKLYFINFDEFNNIFGCFTTKSITDVDSYQAINDPNHFLFSIYSNGRIKKPTRYFKREGRAGGVKINSDITKGFYDIGSNGMGHGCCTVGRPGDKKSWCHYFSHTYNGVYGNEITGTVWKYPNFQRFIINRVLIVEMCS